MSEKSVENIRADNDGAWKNILSTLLKDFVEFFWEEAYQDIDWTRPYELLEQELMAIGIEEEIGKRHIDKLFKMYLKNGREQWILLHIEIQHSKDEKFSERMFTYFYRIYDRYHQDIASLAVLVDKDVDWRPNQYHRQVWKSEIKRTYEIVKLIDFKSKIEELHQHINPFALAVLVQLTALETKADNEIRLLTKLEFFRALHQHNWPIEKIMEVYRFLDIILSLNSKLEVQYIEKAKQIDEEYRMNLTLTAERYGFQQGEAHLLMSQLQAKFKELPEPYLKKIKSADVETLNKWAINFVNASSLDEVFKN